MKWTAIIGTTVSLIAGCGDSHAQAEKKDAAKNISASSIAETRTIAEEGFIYGLPIVMNYAVMYAYAVDKNSGQFKAPFNEIKNESRVYTYKDTAVVTPNSDTPYSFVWIRVRGGVSLERQTEGFTEMNTTHLGPIACALALLSSIPYTVEAQTTVSPAEARAIAKEAYIYGYPLVDNYRIEHAYFVDRQDTQFKAPWNQITNIPRVYAPADTAVQTPNSDTPYSWLGLDLRAEPIVLTLPPMDRNDRYFSVQLTDAYTFNFAYLGSRTTGDDGGSFLVAGPNWKGEMPKGVKKVIRSETELIVVVYRTQLFDPSDIDNVKKIQAGYKVQTLSAFTTSAAPKAAPAIDFIKPLTPETQKTSLEFFNIVNFVLQFCPMDPTEKELMARFAKIGVGAGKTFDPNKLTPELRAAIEHGRTDAWAAFAEGVKLLDEGKLTSGDLFGTRQSMKNNYLNRWLGTIGIYGNSKQEAIYPIYRIDSSGQKLEGANRYTLRFAPGQLPPVNAFWSLTMYELPASLLVANPINRFLINSPMLPQLERDADGGLTLLIQNQSPGKDMEANWLPAPKGPFAMYMRLYWPKEAALSGKWKAPPLQRAKN